ncbi:MAG: ribosome maturation factor RimM [Alphaproteobacteria bacterium]
MPEKLERVCIGAIAGPQGVRGGMRIKAFTGEPDDVAGYGPLTDESGKRRFELRLIGHSRGMPVVRIAGIEDRGAADALKGTRLYVERSALPETEENEYYHADLIGLETVDSEGRPLGAVIAVHDFGAGDIVEIAHSGGRTSLVPFTRACVPVVDIAGGRIVLDPPPGILDQDDEDDEKHDAAKD